MEITAWISNNYIEIFGAIAGIIYVFLEIRQNIWLWPVGIITSAVYIEVFFSSKFYADMSLQLYYLIISILGWYWWVRKSGSVSGDSEKKGGLTVSRIKAKTGIILACVYITLHGVLWLTLSQFTDSPVPGWDSFVTSLSVIATWMLARKIFEHWYLWIVVNAASAVIFTARGLYPTVILYIVYAIMSFAGLKSWRKSFDSSTQPTPDL